MSLSAVLDVVIGLIFIYLLLGLIASALQEAVAAILQLRARNLHGALEQLLSTKTSGQPLADVLLHPLVRNLSPTKLPSYVPARNFSLSVIEVLRAADKSLPVFGQVEAGIAKLPEGPTRASLTAFLDEARGDIDIFKARVETWFDDAMERVSGEYKRFSHYFALAIGLVVAIGCNVDSISVARTLWQDPATRAAMVAAAQTYGASHPQLTKSSNEELSATVRALPLPMGWLEGSTLPPKDIGWWVILGWLITALAVSLGAPFWFDLLQKFLNIRAAGPRPDRSDAAPPPAATS